MSRVALVTGGSRGIGRAISERLGEQGHRVAVNYVRNAAAAKDTAETITAAGGEAVVVQADVGDADAVGAMIDDVAEMLGPVEILINNAGTTDDDLLLRMKPEVWEAVLRTNLTSVYLCTRAALRGMLRARWGRIISISSVAALAGNPGQANYSAAKAGIIGFTKSIAKEVGSRGVTVNVVAPGFIETDLTSDLRPEVVTLAVDRIALGRFGSPEEVASAVGYLASDEAAYITGQTVVVDGGLAL